MPISRRTLLKGGGLAAIGGLAYQVGRSDPTALAFRAAATSAQPDPWRRGLRGMASSCVVRDADIAAFAATGGNVLRVHFCDMPMLSRTSPYGLNDAAFTRLDEIIASCRTHGLYLIVDPHAFPGVASLDTCYPSDQLWRSAKFQDLLVELWSYVAKRYQQAGDVIVGYDLVNEPAVPDVSAVSGLASWNALATRLVAAVRAHDGVQRLIIEPAVGPGPGGRWYHRFEAMRYLLQPPDFRTVVSPHMYAPSTFTFQGVGGNPTGYTYPGTNDGAYWDKQALSAYMAPALTYSQRYGVPVYIGEFSAARWTGPAGVRYLSDNISVFEQWGWAWTYYAWREYQGWNAEMSSDPSDFHRYATTPRLDMLKSYYARNA